jgi:signal transduction histidine kinase
MNREPIVLIVDDSPAGQKALESLLLGQGYKLAIAGDGEQALAMAEQLQPDLILLDVMMPGMDGFEVCRRLRANAELAGVPVVMVTALDDSDSKLAGFESGADDFISKPFGRVELRARVRGIIRLNRYRALLEDRARLDELSQQLLEAHERERRSLAVELHDEIGQELTGLILLVRQASELASTAEAKHKLEDALEIGSDLIARVRDLSLSLRPSMLDDFGLFPALTWLARQFGEKAGLEITCDFTALDEKRFSPAIETAVFRIAQEALTNASRHAHARHAAIRLNEVRSGLTLSVWDDGQGFDIELLRKQKRASTGLSGMRERARIAGGVLEIDSTSGSGTTITATFPFV